MQAPLFSRRLDCPVCHGTQAITHFRANFSEPRLWAHLCSFYHRAGDEIECLRGHWFQLDECVDCSLIFQRYTPNATLIAQLYDGWVRQRSFDEKAWTQWSEAPASSRYGQELLAFSHWSQHRPEQLRVLDFGMGWGEWCRVAQKLKFQSCGFEISTQRIEHAHRHGIQTVGWPEMASCSFDFINADQVFEHISDPVTSLTGLAQALKPGGILKISVPRAPGLKWRLIPHRWQAPRWSPLSLTAVAPLEHLQCYNAQSLRILAQSGGLVQTDIPIESHWAFLREQSLTDLRQTVRGLIRPVYHKLNWNNQYYWFQKT